MFPQWKLATIGLAFAKSAFKHRKKLLHAADVELLVHDLGEALDEQRNILTNPRNSTIETAYDLSLQFAEVGFLRFMVVKHLKIETKGKENIEILKEVVDKMEKQDDDAAFAIRNNLKWFEEFYKMSEVDELMSKPPREINGPKAFYDVLGAGRAVGGHCSRAFDKTKYFHSYMKLAKKFEKIKQKELARQHREEANDNSPKKNKKVISKRKKNKGGKNGLK